MEPIKREVLVIPATVEEVAKEMNLGEGVLKKIMDSEDFADALNDSLNDYLDDYVKDLIHDILMEHLDVGDDEDE